MIELNREEPKAYDYSFLEKQIVLIPMHHLGKQEFYDNVRSMVISYKADGYKVYYELISTQFTADSLGKDLIRRKVRKLKGFNGTYSENAKGSMFEKYVQQPAYSDMGISDGDVRADVDYLELITKWETTHGPIVLDSTDLSTPFTERYEKGTFYSRKQYNETFIHFRNQRVIDLIKQEPEKRILLLYGAGHRKDLAHSFKKGGSE
ncbi:MAG: hypothetical protein M3R08_00740 [Bacteroidota bacterium]|nr:hypothetical protein [Bacteroidota bacterium]